MNYDIHYLTQYRYDGSVTDNLNSLRVRPATTSTQRCDEFHLRLDPEARVQRYVDYFGTEVLEFGVARPHDHLTIDVRARVVTSPAPEPPNAAWEALLTESYLEAAGEFVLPQATDPFDPLVDLVGALDAPTPLASVNALADLIPNRFAYQPGATYVGSTVDDFLAAGAGVCQDFAHLGVVLLRRRGIAARYVSGYLFSTRALGTANVGDEIGLGSTDNGTDSVEVQTHAWIEALLPAEDESAAPVWIGVDPTNRMLVGETHVKIGHGRSYSDIPPTKGVYFGSAGANLEVSVTMTRLDAAASART